MPDAIGLFHAGDAPGSDVWLDPLEPADVVRRDGSASPTGGAVGRRAHGGVPFRGWSG